MRLMEEIQARFPDLKPEHASQIMLAETLKLCTNIIDMTKLPVSPKIIDLLFAEKLIDKTEHNRLINILDPQIRPGASADNG